MRLLSKVTPLTLLIVFFLAGPLAAQGTYDPSCVATIFIDGIDGDGPDQTGVFGVDIQNDLVDEFACLLGTQTGVNSPTARNQITLCDYYGDESPTYYSAADNATLSAIDSQYGGGGPRYAFIVGRFARRVMERSGAKQVNLLAGSMGALVGRWIIEHDVEGLASGGKIARYLTVEGIVCGNWAADKYDDYPDLADLMDDLDQPTIDIEHIAYDWVETNLRDPRHEQASPFYANILVAHTVMTDDSLNNHLLTAFAREANDGLQLVEDAYFRSTLPAALHNGQPPATAYLYATHYSSKDHPGLRAAAVAAMEGRRRVRLTLERAEIDDYDQEIWEGSDLEIVFECKVWSPEAARRFSITDEIAERGFDGRDSPLEEMEEDQEETLNWLCYDGFLLPGETQLTVRMRPVEVDFDERLIYDVFEYPADPTDTLSKWQQAVDVTQSGVIDLDGEDGDWNGRLVVEVINYPAFLPCPGAGPRRSWFWSFY